MMEATKGFGRLKACKQLPARRGALNAHHAKRAAVEEKIQSRVASKPDSARSPNFNSTRDIPKLSFQIFYD